MAMKRAWLAAGLLAAVAAGGVRAADRAATDSSGHKALLAAGYRGVAIPVSGGRLAFVKKGDRVDVIVVFDAQMKDSKEKVGATILQDVVVEDVRKPATLEGLGAVELIVNPNEAQYAALSLSQGEVHLAIRAPDDTKMTPMEMASFRKLFR